jgi:hypothetical protein
VELELIHSFVMRHVKERLPVHLQDLVADLKHNIHGNPSDYLNKQQHF